MHFLCELVPELVSTNADSKQQKVAVTDSYVMVNVICFM